MSAPAVLVTDAAVEAMIASIQEQGAVCPRVTTNRDCLIMGGWSVNIRKALKLAIEAQMTPVPAPPPKTRKKKA